MSEYLFNELPALGERIKNADSVTLFLDYDGTLVGFRNKPMETRPSEDVINVLKKILETQRINTFIITGRNPEHIKSFLPLKDLKFICIHGFIMDFADFRMDISEEDKEIIGRIYEDVKKEFSDLVSDMNKKEDIGINFNYRSYKGDKEELRRRFIEIVKRHDTERKLRIMDLSECINVLSKNWDKGKAVNLVLEKHAPKDALPIYFGDDVTDEDAFEVLRDKGITVYVNNDDTRESKAEFFVKNPDETLKALKELFN